MIPDIAYPVLRLRQRVFNKIKGYLYGETLLDSGCGDGSDAVLFGADFKKVQGIDMEENPMWKKLADDRTSFSRGDSMSLSFPDNSFDTVIEKDMIHHVPDPVRAVKEMVRVSKKRAIVIECNRYNPIMYVNMVLIHGHQHFTQKRFKEIVLSAGVSCEISHFSARLIPFNNKAVIDFFESVEDLLEKVPIYRPIIEYNVAVLTK